MGNKLMSSKHAALQVLGAMVHTGWQVFLILLAIALAVVVFALPVGNDTMHKFLQMTLCITLFLIVYGIVHVLTPLYSLRKEEQKVTVAQTALLLALGLLIAAFIIIFHIESEGSAGLITVGIIGSVLSWVFRDTIRSVAAFFYLRSCGLIHIGDWIEVRSHGIDGAIRSVTLTTVTVENWDTTTSSFPTHVLISDGFRNHQKMVDGRTHGRQMLKTFIFDTGCARTIEEEEAERLREIISTDGRHLLKDDEIVKGALNIELYRKYLYHWLMRDSKISHEPCLMVRWREQTAEGLPLQVYAFITDTSVAPYEWEQSRIIEHVVESVEWFGLRLYQRPSGHDASNINNLKEA